MKEYTVPFDQTLEDERNAQDALTCAGSRQPEACYCSAYSFPHTLGTMKCEGE